MRPGIGLAWLSGLSAGLLAVLTAAVASAAPEIAACDPVYIFFQSREAALAPQALPAIAAAAKILIAGNLPATVSGHTDGQEGDDKPLSERRAAAVKREFVRLGVKGETLETVGKGLVEPLAPIAPDVRESFNRYVIIDFCGPDRLRK